MSTIDTVKTIVGGIVDIGVGFVSVGVLDRLCPGARGIKKIFTAIGTAVLGGMICKQANDFVNDCVDQCVEQIGAAVDEARKEESNAG